MYYCFIKRCRLEDGRVDFYPHMVHASGEREAEARVRKSFDEMSVYGSKEEMRGRPRVTLEEIKSFGSADSREAALALYDRACKAAEKKGADREAAEKQERKDGESREDTTRAGPDAE